MFMFQAPPLGVKKKTERKESCYSGIKKRSEGTIVNCSLYRFLLRRVARLEMDCNLKPVRPILLTGLP